MRREVMSALASLSDRDYQERAWLRHEYPPPIEYDDFDQVIHTLYDDMQALNYEAAGQTAAVLVVLSFAALCLTYALQRRVLPL